MNTITFRRKIVATKEQKKAIAKEFGCTLTTIHYSLNFERDSALAKAIRSKALSLGAQDVTMVPASSVLVDEGDIIRQSFANGVEIVVCKSDNQISLWKGGERVWYEYQGNFSVLKSVQEQAKILSNQVVE